MVNFNFSFNPGTSLQQMIGFEIAGRIWSSYLTDNTTINLQVGVSNQLAGNVIGGALPGMVASASYSSVRAALQKDAKSSNDWTAFNHIPDVGGSVQSWFCTWSMDLNQPGWGYSFNTTQLNLTRANAKALGISTKGNANALDGYILFSDLSQAQTATGQAVQWNYDYTRQTTPASNSLDFLSTAIHEIGHILGFTSNVDTPGWLSLTTQTTDYLRFYESLENRAQNVNPLDLFRYSQETSSYGAIDLAIGGSGAEFVQKYFSIDGGSTAIANFSAGVDSTLQGDGAQASHWQSGTNAIMAPTLRTGTRSSISNIDLTVFDVIGWDLVRTGINTAMNLSSLLTQSKQSLASRLGQTVSWLNANSTTAAANLAQNRDQDIYTMLVNSRIYDLSRITPPSSGGGRSQTFSQLFEERGLFETLDELQVASSHPEGAEGGDLSIEQQILTLNLSRITPPGSGGGPSSIQIQFWEDGSLDQVVVNRRRVTPPGSGGGPSGIVIILDMSFHPDTANSTDPSSSDPTWFNYYDSSINTTSLPSNSTTSSDGDAYLNDILDLPTLV